MLRAVIIDDERKSRESLQLLLDSFVENVSIVGTADGVYTGINVINEKEPDIVFLDIHLANGDGFQVLDGIKNRTQNIIFVTGHEEHAIQAFRSEAIDYLLKPVIIEQLQDAVERVKSKINSKSENLSGTIALSTNKGVQFVKTEDILYCKGDGAYTYFHLKKGERITTSKNLKEYEEKLSHFHFFRSHKSFLLNLAEIKNFKRGENSHAIMSNGDTVGVSKRRKDEFLIAIGGG